MNDAKAPLRDVKEALSSSRKPDITHVRTPTLNYIGRSSEYGDYRYERANYLRPTENVAADFRRYRAYLRALVSHAVHTLDAMERHQSQDPRLEDVPGMRRACFAADMDAPANGKLASGLPHIAMAMSSGNMAITQAVDAGLLPLDPGRPWEQTAKTRADATPPPAPPDEPDEYARSGAEQCQAMHAFAGSWWNCVYRAGHSKPHMSSVGVGFTYDESDKFDALAVGRPLEPRTLIGALSDDEKLDATEREVTHHYKDTAVCSPKCTGGACCAGGTAPMCESRYGDSAPMRESRYGENTGAEGMRW